MAILAQHGHGKGDKVDIGLSSGVIDGVVLSPRHEEPDRLSEYVVVLRDSRGDNCVILVDPQFYLSALGAVNEGKLPDYSYYRPGLTRRSFIRGSSLQEYAQETLEFQSQLPLSAVIAPSVLFRDFRDPWSQIALSIGEESIAAWTRQANGLPLMIPLVFNETALHHRDALNEFLDVISVWEVEGFYVVVEREDSSYPSLFDENVLANLMYLTYVLAILNGFRLIFGYTDLETVPLQAVGAAACATGWYNNLRQFNVPWSDPGIRRQPRARYTSTPLLASVLVVPELTTAVDLGLANDLATSSAVDGPLLGDPANADWPLRTACLHHWEALAAMAAGASSNDVRENLDRLVESISTARGTYALLMSAGVPFELRSGPARLDVWQKAVDTFRAERAI